LAQNLHDLNDVASLNSFWMKLSLMKSLPAGFASPPLRR